MHCFSALLTMPRNYSGSVPTNFLQVHCITRYQTQFQDQGQVVIGRRNSMSSPSVYVVTGASRGLGLEFTKQVSICTFCMIL